MGGFSHLGSPSIKARSGPAFPEPLCGPGPPNSLLGQWSRRPREGQVWGQGSQLQPWVGVGATQQVEIRGQVAKLDPCPAQGLLAGESRGPGEQGPGCSLHSPQPRCLEPISLPVQGRQGGPALQRASHGAGRKSGPAEVAPAPPIPTYAVPSCPGGAPRSPPLSLWRAGVLGSRQVTSAALVDQMPRH